MQRVETTKLAMKEAVLNLQAQVIRLQNEKLDMERVFRHELKQKNHQLELAQMRFMIEYNSKF
jgi:hypothetical protein